MNPYFTPTLFDSDNFNSDMYNMNQSYKPDWDYLTQYDPYPQSYDHNFQNNFNFSQSQWGFTSPELNFQSPCPSSSFPYSTLHTPFPEPPIKEKSKIQKSIETMLESQQQILQNMLDSSFQPNYQESYSSFPVSSIQNEQPSVL